MVSFFLGLFGYEVVYVSEWGEFRTRYDSVDRYMFRPIHKDMGTAPPWAKMRLRKRLPNPAARSVAADNANAGEV